MKNNIIKVSLSGKDVGRLVWDGAKGCAIFKFDPEFASTGPDICPVLYPKGGPERTSGRPLAGFRDKTYAGLPPFIADSLPDLWGRKVYKAWLDKGGVNQDELTPVDYLQFVGKRSMGALEFEPELSAPDETKAIELEKLVAVSRDIESDRYDFRLSAYGDDVMNLLYKLGTSAGGKRPKAIIAVDCATGEIRSGQIPLPDNFVYCIIKFNVADDFPFTKVEAAYYRMATAAGITMMPSSLIEIGGERHFVTERFDRKAGGAKVFTQTLAAVNPSASNYEELFRTARKLEVPQKEIDELFARTAFNFLAGNVDDHNKNFSFLMDEGGLWHISPAYDMTFTVELGNELQNYHFLSLTGKVKSISDEDLLEFAQMNDVRNPDKILQQVKCAIEKFPSFAEECGIDALTAKRINDYLQHLLGKDVRKAVSAVEPFTLDGHAVGDVSLTRSPDGTFRLDAKIDGKPCRKFFKKNSATARAILLKGGVYMPANDKKRLAALLLPESEPKENVSVRRRR